MKLNVNPDCDAIDCVEEMSTILYEIGRVLGHKVEHGIYRETGHVFVQFELDIRREKCETHN